mmetsp:Transcript_16722/g.34473  ORF Transcript_16722/g.34473 Transcript_16722/m.34473 type:complete len:324 (+) Transcript_16722:292-1263(+)|eukprot:CAMPEP_0118665624 /NCGR_PEP_ID=MMETSP0785-20121206/18725_1 /TAXON_ID=91992 /ORGANISM="Bolidomonas pacifica, Strain CCMP 1866" /LENGTH=323 /DNA_ID=CAMNT_0006559769 /DNA_START=280 /DNA_END=1251 /DNA_ORIENTATION=+
MTFTVVTSPPSTSLRSSKMKATSSKMKATSSKRKAESSGASSGFFLEQPRKRLVSSCDEKGDENVNTDWRSTRGNTIEGAKGMSRSMKSFKDLVSCSTSTVSIISSSTFETTASTTPATNITDATTSTNHNSKQCLPPVCPPKPLVTPTWEDGGCVSDSSSTSKESFNSLPYTISCVAGTMSSFAPSHSSSSSSSSSSSTTADNHSVPIISELASPMFPTSVTNKEPPGSSDDVPIDQWGWFVKMDNSYLDNRPLVTQPKKPVVSFENLRNVVKLAFVRDRSPIATAPVEQQDPSLRWASAADTVDEVLGELDLPDLPELPEL